MDEWLSGRELRNTQHEPSSIVHRHRPQTKGGFTRDCTKWALFLLHKESLLAGGVLLLALGGWRLPAGLWVLTAWLGGSGALAAERLLLAQAGLPWTAALAGGWPGRGWRRWRCSAWAGARAERLARCGRGAPRRRGPAHPVRRR